MDTQRNLGKYRIIAELGHGGMADVYLAMVAGPSGSGFTKLAVVKRLRPNLVEDPEFVAMLVDEARITARLNHPNVVQTLEVGVEGEEYYLAMEFLDGQPLHRILKRSARGGSCMPREMQYLILADTLAGLHHAHELADYDGTALGVVHRDISPQNVFVTYDGRVKVVDFGIAKAVGRASETKAGIVKGKIRYMSPEQAVGQHIDRRSDVFAVGILLWEAATGMKFWGDQDDLAIVQSLISGAFNPSPASVDSTVAPQIDAICRKAMAPSPDDRYATAADLRADLDMFLADEQVNIRRRLGPMVSDLFRKERQQIRGVIELASRETADRGVIAPLATSSSSDVLVALPPIRTLPPPPGSLVPIVVPSLPPSANRSSLAPRASLRPSMGAPRPRKRRVSMAAMQVAVLAITMTIVIIAGNQVLRPRSATAFGNAANAANAGVAASLAGDAEAHAALSGRVASQLVGERLRVELSSRAAKDKGGSSTFYPLLSSASAGMARGPAPTLAANDAPASPASPGPSGAGPAPAKADAPRPAFRRPAIDLADPWATARLSN